MRATSGRPSLGTLRRRRSTSRARRGPRGGMRRERQPRAAPRAVGRPEACHKADGSAEHCAEGAPPVGRGAGDGAGRDVKRAVSDNRGQARRSPRRRRSTSRRGHHRGPGRGRESSAGGALARRDRRQVVSRARGGRRQAVSRGAGITAGRAADKIVGMQSARRGHRRGRAAAEKRGRAARRRGARSSACSQPGADTDAAGPRPRTWTERCAGAARDRRRGRDHRQAASRARPPTLAGNVDERRACQPPAANTRPTPRSPTRHTAQHNTSPEGRHHRGQDAGQRVTALWSGRRRAVSGTRASASPGSWPGRGLGRGRSGAPGRGPQPVRRSGAGA